MKRCQGLFEKVADFGALREAALRAARGKRDRDEVAEFLLHLESECLTLEKELKEGRYQPGPYRTFTIYEHKPRLICAAPFRDRVVHHAVSAALSPRLEAFAIHDSYACRVGKGTHHAILKAQTFARAEGYVLKLDIRKFFPSIDIAILLSLFERRLKDRALLSLLSMIFKHSPPGSAPGKGLPIGNLTSQHAANFYLGHLDHFIKDEMRIKRMLRYMDDILVFADDAQTLQGWHQDIRAFLHERLALSLKDEQTLLAPIREGIPFLGFRIWPSVIRLNPRSYRRFCKNFTFLLRGVQQGRLDETTARLRMCGLQGHSASATFRLREALLASL